MSHPFGDTVTHLLHRKHGLSLSKLATGINQPHSVVSLMCHGQRLTGPQARERVVAIIGWLYQRGTLTTQEEANALLQAAGMAGLDEARPAEARLLHELRSLPPATTERQEVPGEGSSLPLVPAGPIADPALPPLSLEAAGLIGRDAQLAHLKARLRSGQAVGLTALNGLPGVGKTTLAVALAHDEEIKQQFQGGILWAGLGPQPNLLAHLSRWGTLLGTPGVAASKLTTLEAWTPLIRAAIGERQMLLVVDDAWQIEDALAFRVGGPHCAYLVTTRFPQIAVQFAGEGVLVVREFSAEESLTLLDRLAPQAVTSEPEAAQALVRASGGLPLAVTLMGKYLRTEAYAEQPRRIRAALERLRDAQARLALSDAQPLVERSPTLTLHTPRSLQSVIAISDQQVEAPAQAALRALAVFPAKPNTFSEEATLVVCQASVEVLDRLTDAGLLESAGSGRYTLHQTIWDYARLQLTDQSAYVRLATYWADFAVAHRKDYAALEQEQQNLVAALQAASKYQVQAPLVRCIIAFAWFLQARGLYAQAEGFLTEAEAAARALEDGAGLAAVFLHLGRIRFNRGDYDQAEASLQDGVRCARQSGDQERLCHLLNWLGAIARNRGAYSQADAFHQEGVTLARQVGDAVLISTLLTGLGINAWEAGHYDQAEACLQEGLTFAHQSGDRERVCETLVNCGSVAYTRGHDAEGERFYREALELARQIGYRQAVTVLLGNVGEIAMEQGRYPQAEAYLREALETARQLGNRDLISANLVNLGRIALRQEDTTQAEGHLHEALLITRQTGYHRNLCDTLYTWGELQLHEQRWSEAAIAFGEMRALTADANPGYLALADYGLARVAAAQGDISAARALGHKSLRRCESSGHRMTGEVRAWLEALPGQPS